MQVFFQAELQFCAAFFPLFLCICVVERINEKFDDILTYLADGILPEWQKIDSLETYFAKERLEYLKATETGPKNMNCCISCCQDLPTFFARPW